MKKGRFSTLFIMGLAAIATYAAPKPTLLSIKETITDNSIVYPESFETDTKQMMQNWYLQNYTVLDEDVEKKSANDVSDEEYIKRLKAMPVVIEMPYNQVVRSYIDMYVQKRRTLVESMLGMSLYYMPIFEQSLEKEGLPLELKYLPVIESALNPDAVSRVGAAGLWQFMISTAKGLGLEVNSLVDERRDPYRASEKAAKYLKQLYGIYGDWSLAIAAYNCGPNSINKAIRRSGGDGKDFWTIYPYLPRETRGYFPAFIAANYVMTYFKYHNISPGLAKKPIVTDTVKVNGRVNLNQIAGVLNMPIDELRVLNPQYRKDVIPGDSHPYYLALPSHQVCSYIMSEDSIKNFHLDLYGQREVVDPSKARYDNSSSSNYTYETRLVTKTHRVGRGETLSSIARHYGISVGALKSSNGLRRSRVRRGTVLRFKTYQRVRIRHNRDEGGNESEEVEEDNTADNSGDTTELEEGADNSVATSEDNSSKEEVTNSPYVGSHRIGSSHKSSSNKQAAKESSSTKEKTSGESSKSKTVKAAPEEESPAAKWRTDRKKKEAAEEKQVSKRSSSKSEKAESDESSSKSSKYSSRKSRQQDEEQSYSSKSKKSRRAAAREEKASRSKKAKRSKSHSVKEGESLYEIAHEHGVSVNDLKEANDINGSTIQPGQKIKIPGKNSSSDKSSKKSRKKHRR